MKAYEVFEETPIEFGKLHRVALLATPYSLAILGAVFAFALVFIGPDFAVVALFVGTGLSLVVAVVTGLSVAYAIFIMLDAPRRRVIRNVAPTLLGLGSLVVLFFLVPLVIDLGPQ